MANLEFCDTHNMVAYLNKLEGSEGFHQIVDFLNHNHIRAQLFRESKVPQPRSPTQTPAADEAASIGVDVRHGGDTTTISSLDAGQASGNIDKTPTMPHDSPLLRVHTLGSDEGKMQHNKLMDLVTKLSDIIVALETDLRQTKKVYGAAYTKLIKKVKKLEISAKSRQSRRRANIVVSDDEDDSAKVLADATKENVHTYTRRRAVSTAGRISTAEESVSTAGALMPVSTAGISQEVNISIPSPVVIKDKEERKRIARVHEEASSLNIEEWEDIQATIEADEELAQRIQAEEREKYSEAKKARLLAELINQRKTYFAQQRAKERRTNHSHKLNRELISTMRRVGAFVPMETEIRREVPELAAGSSKRDVEEELDQGSSKRQKTSENSEPAKESKEKENDELSQEEL
ncbi:hypothetical protein Tco_0047862 [Tanacetum coccineum]